MSITIYVDKSISKYKTFFANAYYIKKCLSVFEW